MASDWCLGAVAMPRRGRGAIRCGLPLVARGYGDADVDAHVACFAAGTGRASISVYRSSQPTRGSGVPSSSQIISVYGIFISHEPEFLNFQHIPGNKSITWPSHPTIVSAANLEL